jgi:hypothetical protein
MHPAICLPFSFMWDWVIYCSIIGQWSDVIFWVMSKEGWGWQRLTGTSYLTQKCRGICLPLIQGVPRPSAEVTQGLPQSSVLAPYSSYSTYSHLDRYLNLNVLSHPKGVSVCLWSRVFSISIPCTTRTKFYHSLDTWACPVYFYCVG